MIEYTIYPFTSEDQKIITLFKQSPEYGKRPMKDMLNRMFNVIDLKYNTKLDKILYFKSEKDLTMFLLRL